MVFGFAGCNKDNSYTLPEGEPALMIMQAEGNDIANFSWQNGDAFSVWGHGVTGNENCKVVAG